MHALARAGSVVGAEAGWRAPPPCRPQAVVVRKMRRGMRRKHARYAPTPQPPPPDPLWIRAHFHFRGAGGVRLTHDWYVELERDVHMPDMDGFKLLEHIALELDIPVMSESTPPGPRK